MCSINAIQGNSLISVSSPPEIRGSTKDPQTNGFGKSLALNAVLFEKSFRESDRSSKSGFGSDFDDKALTNTKTLKKMIEANINKCCFEFFVLLSNVQYWNADRKKKLLINAIGQCIYKNKVVTINSIRFQV